MPCTQSLEPMPMLSPRGKAGSDELLSPDALLNTGTGKPNSPSAHPLRCCSPLAASCVRRNTLAEPLAGLLLRTA